MQKSNVSCRGIISTICRGKDDVIHYGYREAFSRGGSKNVRQGVVSSGVSSGWKVPEAIRNNQDISQE